MESDGEGWADDFAVYLFYCDVGVDMERSAADSAGRSQ
jgi:hypothetical protein